MRTYEKRETKIDRALIDLRDERDHVSIQISLLASADLICPGEMGTLKRNLGILDDRIARHRAPIGA